MNQRFETYEAVEDTYSHQEQNSLGYFADETSPGMIPSEFVSNCILYLVTRIIIS